MEHSRVSFVELKPVKLGCVKLDGTEVLSLPTLLSGFRA